jgi:photosystem II stability/assembly factor-like uncharacterized protein
VRSVIKRILVVSTLGMAALAASAADTAGGLIKTLAQGIPHSAFFGISFDGDVGVAVGMGGAIAASADGGSTWTPVKQSVTDAALLAVAKRGAHTVAVGQAGLVMVEEAPGTWVKGESGVPGRLLSVSVNSSGLAVAGGQFATLIRSTDGGKTWAAFGPDWNQYADESAPGTNEPTIYSVHVSEGGTVTIAGEFGLIFRLDAGSEQWRVLNPLKAGTSVIFATHISDSPKRNSYAVGQSGQVLISTDNGETWFANPVKTDSNFLGVAAAPGGKVVVTGMRVMVTSSDGGITWNTVTEGDVLTDWYQAVRAVPKTGKVIAVGHSGRIIQIGS